MGCGSVAQFEHEREDACGIVEAFEIRSFADMAMQAGLAHKVIRTRWGLWDMSQQGDRYVVAFRILTGVVLIQCTFKPKGHAFTAASAAHLIKNTSSY